MDPAGRSPLHHASVVSCARLVATGAALLGLAAASSFGLGACSAAAPADPAFYPPPPPPPPPTPHPPPTRVSPPPPRKPDRTRNSYRTH